MLWWCYLMFLINSLSLWKKMLGNVYFIIYILNINDCNYVTIAACAARGITRARARQKMRTSGSAQSEISRVFSYCCIIIISRAMGIVSHTHRRCVVHTHIYYIHRIRSASWVYARLMRRAELTSHTRDLHALFSHSLYNNIYKYKSAPKMYFERSWESIPLLRARASCGFRNASSSSS